MLVRIRPGTGNHNNDRKKSDKDKYKQDKIDIRLCLIAEGNGVSAAAQRSHDLNISFDWVYCAFDTEPKKRALYFLPCDAVQENPFFKERFTVQQHAAFKAHETSLRTDKEHGPRRMSRRHAMASEIALEGWGKRREWNVAIFKGKKGPRTGIVDAILARLKPENQDELQIRLVQLKSGNAGMKASEIGRMITELHRLRRTKRAVKKELCVFDPTTHTIKCAKTIK